jgi:hypothetical protein
MHNFKAEMTSLFEQVRPAGSCALEKTILQADHTFLISDVARLICVHVY